jgi:TRAP-type C4-dicarboxylate transport system permease small subunit
VSAPRQLLAAAAAMLARALRWMVIAGLVLALLFLALGVLGRQIAALNFSGNHEIVEILFAWTCFLGAAALWREGTLLRVDMLGLLLPAPARWSLEVALELVLLGFALLLVYYGWDLATGITEYTPFLKANKLYWYAALPISGAIMAGYSLARIGRLLATPFVVAPSAAKQQEIL